MMRRVLQALPLAAEFAIVILGAFGVFFVATFLSLLDSAGSVYSGDTSRYSGGHLFSLVVYELPIGAVLFAFLRVRGWSLKRLGVRFTAGETLIGFALAFCAEFACYATLWAVAIASPAFVRAIRAWDMTPGGFGLATVIVVSIVNPIFEETFVCGYVISVLKERADFSTAITISVAIRLLYHLYQGPIAFIGIIPFGLVLGWWYARTGRLWPAIVAHGLGDFIAMVGYAT
jgi:membrane protease YdiL (CAAX protease family)